MPYVSSMAMRQSRTIRKNQNIIRFQPNKSGIGPVSNMLILALILSLFGLLYLTQITKTNSYGYQVNDLKDKKEQLVKENQALEVESARLQALERIKSSKVAKKLSNQGDVTFVESVQ